MEEKLRKRRIAILGSTGSIGTQALDVIRQHRDLFEVELLTANNSSDLLIRQAIEFDANAVVICNEDKYEDVSQALAPHYTKVFAGIQSVCDAVCGDNIDMVLTSMVGFSGLKPTVAAIKAGKSIALANKETLVAAGEIIMEMSQKYHAPIIPVDSEHSAIFQCLLGANGAEIHKIHPTASGGPFRTWSKDEIAKADCKAALKHPNWNMGSKVTIDSATMMNKGLEMIEAKWLFGVNPDQIEVVVHPESIIHSMVEYDDGAVIAQMGWPDMRQPIQFALAFPRRLSLNNRKPDFSEIAQLNFYKPDTDRFPALAIAREALSKGGNSCCIMNAANEVAVAEYLHGHIGFYDISDIVRKTLDTVTWEERPSIEDIFETHTEALEAAREIAGGIVK